jgi:hypothetical protein
MRKIVELGSEGQGIRMETRVMVHKKERKQQRGNEVSDEQVEKEPDRTVSVGLLGCNAAWTKSTCITNQKSNIISLLP